MNTHPSSQSQTSRAEMLYRSLLLLYPSSFRRAYEREMLQTFRDCYRDTLQHEGVVGLTHLWSLMLRDLSIFERNQTQFNGRTQDTAQKGMGTTCVAVVLKDSSAYIANAGDSLVYLVRTGQVRQIAEDHSWIAEQVRTGKMTQAEADAEGKTSVITRCLGVADTVDVYVGTEQVQDKDILILCTDGLHTLVSEDEIRTLVEQYRPQESAQRLIARANENGGPDNSTAVVVRVSLSNG